MRDLPESLAIAGAWGYIGRKFLDVATRYQIPVFVYDPGSLPPDVDPRQLTRLTDDAEFYRLPAELFHLATHPDQRRSGQQHLLDRARREPLVILNEKPMAAPESPDECAQIVAAVRDSQATMLYDFPELYDPLTECILDHLRTYRDVQLTEISLCRSKDRESPDKPRNYKRMVPIQYQESVHCLAFVLFLLARLRGSWAAALEDGVRVRAQSAPYAPPNPEIYPSVVDGKCTYQLSLGPTQVEGRTDFKAGAEFTKRRVLCGRGDGQPLCIEAEYLEGRKRLVINGRDQSVDPRADSYQSVLQTITRWRREVPRDELMTGLYPNPGLARITYQLSSALWRASRDGAELRFASLDALLGFDASFREALQARPSPA